MSLPPVYAITDRAVSGVDNTAAMAGRLLRVGIRLLQVREKRLSDAELLSSVEQVAADARRVGARVLVNDRTDVASLAGVGVHLGEDDLSPRFARPLVMPPQLVGVSTHDAATAARAFQEDGCDYVAFGPIFSSPTKPGRPPVGLEALRAVAREKTKPLVAIGGITSENIEGVWDAGADSAAMVAGLLAGGRIEESARRVLDLSRRRAWPGRVYLVGFMGSGKTALGKRLAERMGVPFVDLDAEIERTSGVTIRALFESMGEGAFRDREALFLEATESLPQAVIATGGGCYTREENRRRILRLGVPVFLDIPLPVLLERLHGKTDRPLFESPEQVGQLFAERLPLYKLESVRVVLTGRETYEEAVDHTLNTLFDARQPVSSA